MTGTEYRERRLSLDLTQQDLAHLVGVAVSTIQAREQQPDKDVASEAAMAINGLKKERQEGAE